MHKVIKKRRIVKENPAARALASARYRRQVVESRKNYKRAQNRKTIQQGMRELKEPNRSIVWH